MKERRWYRLDGCRPVECAGPLRGAYEYSAWRAQAEARGETPNRVAEMIAPGVRVSTVFLGLDHQWREDGAPVLFETMVLGGAMDEFQERYETWDGALAGHRVIVVRVLKEVSP